MKVILRKDVANLGSIGDSVTVKNGYARNFLIPRNLAYFASPGAIKSLEVEKKQYAKIRAKERSDAEVMGAKLAEMQVSVAMKVGEEGRLYGSVTPMMIADELKVHGIEIDRRNIMLEEPIKSLGIFDVRIKLYSDVIATIKVWVISEE